MEGMYNSNPAFKEYVDKVCVKHGCNVETAFTLSWVKASADYYVDAENRKKNVIVAEPAGMGECK